MIRTASCLALAMLIAAPSGARAAGAPAPIRRPAPLLLTLASASRAAAPFGIVTSTLRSVEHNRAVGGMPNSYHLSGRAIDIARRPGVTHAMIDAMLRRSGYLLVESLDEGDHSHFAFAWTGAAAPLTHIVPQDIASAAPAAPPLPEVPRLAADVHGTLVPTANPFATQLATAGAGVRR